MTDVNFTAEAGFDRQFYWQGGDSVRYLVARLEARSGEDGVSGEEMPVNIALVMDASGSMGGGKLEAAKEAAVGLTGHLTDRDRITLVSFASDVRIHLDAVQASGENADRIREEILRLRTRGSTALSEGWFAGVECTARVAEEDARMTPRVIILSDGHANAGITDPAELREHAGEFRKRGVFTSALGIGAGYDEHLLRGMAENGGGRLHDVEHAGEISTVLLGELGDIYNTVVEDAEVTLTFPAGVRVDALGRENSVLRDDSVLVRLGPIQNGIERVAVFKVTCPGGKAKDVLEFELSTRASSVGDRRILEAGPKTVGLVAADSRVNNYQPRDMKTAEVVARMWSADVVLTASRMNRDGAYSEAKEYVQRELHYFRRYARGLDRGNDMVRELEMLARRVDRRFSPRMHKEMVNQSYQSRNSRADHRGMRDSWSTRMERGE